jgi:ribosomal protein S18 acetylase RimI-like enzyme
MEIITATDKHILEIVELWKEFMIHHETVDPRFPMRKDAHSSFEKHLREILQAEKNLVLVVVDNRNVIGFSHSSINDYVPIWERETYGTIETMAVKSGYRRKGIGEQLLVEIFDWFESYGIDRIELSVATGNETGYSFWKKHGFKDFSHRLYIDKG